MNTHLSDYIDEIADKQKKIEDKLLSEVREIREMCEYMLKLIGEEDGKRHRSPIQNAER